MRTDVESEQFDRRPSFITTLWASFQEHFNPIRAALDSWRMYRELQQRQKEIRSFQRADQRVPNRLWRGTGQHGNNQRLGVWSSMLSVLVACGLLIPIWLQFYAASLTMPRPYNIVVPDVLMVFVACAFCGAAWVLVLCIFNPRWTRLWHISIARRRLSQKKLKERRVFFSSRSAPRRLALLLGVAVYFPFLFAAAGIGNMPSALIAVSAAIGHARVLPIVFFPIAAEVLAGFVRRRRRHRRRLVNAGQGCVGIFN